jgi:hypothetical protein
MHFDPANQLVLFGDSRSESIIVTDRTRGQEDGTRVLHIHPDVLMDFRNLPFSKVRQTVDIWRARNTTRNKIAGEQRWII